MRFMGMDVGEKTIGIAVSDPMGWTAQGLTTLRRQKEDLDIERIRAIIQEHEVKEIVVGLPKKMDGTLGTQALKVLKFMDRLRKEFSLKIHVLDERLTTVAAEKTLLEADLSRIKRKQVIDKMAAVLILQMFLDSLQHQHSPGK